MEWEQRVGKAVWWGLWGGLAGAVLQHPGKGAALAAALSQVPGLPPSCPALYKGHRVRQLPGGGVVLPEYRRPFPSWDEAKAWIDRHVQREVDQVEEAATAGWGAEDGVKPAPDGIYGPDGGYYYQWRAATTALSFARPATYTWWTSVPKRSDARKAILAKLRTLPRLSQAEIQRLGLSERSRANFPRPPARRSAAASLPASPEASAPASGSKLDALVAALKSTASSIAAGRRGAAEDAALPAETEAAAEAEAGASVDGPPVGLVVAGGVVTAVLLGGLVLLLRR